MHWLPLVCVPCPQFDPPAGLQEVQPVSTQLWVKQLLLVTHLQGEQCRTALYRKATAWQYPLQEGHFRAVLSTGRTVQGSTLYRKDTAGRYSLQDGHCRAVLSKGRAL